MEELTREQAVALYESNFWEGMDARDIAVFQVTNDRLCMPFDVFQIAMEEALGRPVFTHELANSDNLKRELFGDKPTPTLAEVLNQIPAEKRIVITV